MLLIFQGQEKPTNQPNIKYCFKGIYKYLGIMKNFISVLLSI